MRALRMLLLGLLLIAFCPSLAATIDTINGNTDCNERCPLKWIKIGFLKTSYRDPTCKGQCEIAKKAARTTGVQIPATKGIVADVERSLTQSCAVAFDLITKPVLLTGPVGNTNAEAAHFRDLENDLIQAGLFNAADFDHVIVRFRALKPGIAGTTPDRDQIFLAESLRDQSDYEQASTLAHEMIHIDQYRRSGTDSFKCNYAKHFVQCSGCQDRGHELEREAYEFEDRARQVLAQYYGQNFAKFKDVELFAPVIKSQGTQISLLGEWYVGRLACGSPSALFYRTGDGIIVASTNCSSAEVNYVGKNQVRALQWNRYGQIAPDGQSIQWNKDTFDVWRRIRRSPRP
jgi:hypothetical protein